MKNPLYDDQEADDLELVQLINEMMAEEQRENMPFEYVPKNLSFPQGFIHFNQFIFPQRIVKLHNQSQIATINPDENINNANNAAAQNKNKKVQIVFGQRVAKPQPPSTVKKPAGYKPTTNEKQQTIGEAVEAENEMEDFYSPLASQLQVKKLENRDQSLEDDEEGVYGQSKLKSIDRSAGK